MLMFQENLMINLKNFYNLLNNNQFDIVPADTNHVYYDKDSNKNLEIINDGGWHFTNIKSPSDLDFKMRNFAHHLEYEESGITLDELKDKMKNNKLYL